MDHGVQLRGQAPCPVLNDVLPVGHEIGVQTGRGLPAGITSATAADGMVRAISPSAVTSAA